jgi:hypothetical protein
MAPRAPLPASVETDRAVGPGFRRDEDRLSVETVASAFL